MLCSRRLSLQSSPAFIFTLAALSEHVAVGRGHGTLRFFRSVFRCPHIRGETIAVNNHIPQLAIFAVAYFRDFLKLSSSRLHLRLRGINYHHHQ